MNIPRRHALLAGAALLGASLLPGIAPAQSLEDIESRGTARIGMLVDFPPFGIMNAENRPDGYDADVARALADYMGVEAELVPVTGPNRIPYLLSGQVDLLVASLGITPERAEQVAFSAPYAGIRIALVGIVDLDMDEPSKLSGRTIGVARASTQDTAITAIAPEDADIRRFDDDASAVQALLSNQVDAIGASNTVIDQIEGVAPGRFDEKFELAQQVQGIALRQDAEALMEVVNEFIAAAKEDGSMSEIHEKWLGSPLPDFVDEQ